MSGRTAGWSASSSLREYEPRRAESSAVRRGGAGRSQTDEAAVCGMRQGGRRVEVQREEATAILPATPCPRPLHRSCPDASPPPLAPHPSPAAISSLLSPLLPPPPPPPLSLLLAPRASLLRSSSRVADISWVAGDDVWGVQNIMHPDLKQPVFAQWYGSDDLLDVSAALMGVTRDEMQFGEYPEAARASRSVYALG